MRPLNLDALFRSVRTLPGIGPKTAKAIERLTGSERVADMLFHLPIDFIDRSATPTIAHAAPDTIATMRVKVDKIAFAARRGQPTGIQVSDETGILSLVYFSASKDWLTKTYPIDHEIIISGKIETWKTGKQMVHPDHVIAANDPAKLKQLAKLEAIYPLTQGLTNKVLSKTIQGALPLVPQLNEWIDPQMLNRQGWHSFDQSLKSAHNPQTPKDIQVDAPSRERLAYDELLARQLALNLVRQANRRQKGQAFAPSVTLREKLINALPFDLTGAQKRVLQEIDTDMQEPLRMLRLLQGDVGSGKTVMALLAAANVIEHGYQAAIMAPTEILARQHLETLTEMTKGSGLRLIALTGRDKGKTRNLILDQIKDGKADIVIGTHALFQDTVAFKSLGLVVVDEQHRFGVHQRMQLSEKGVNPDILVMTATPIPRTLTLTQYGDMDVSRLDEKPAGRQPIDTRLIPNERIGDVVDGLKRKIADGDRAYWVCPLVEESEKLDLAAAEERAQVLEKFFPGKIGLIHGRMKPDEKDTVMQRFINGELSVLVATTVIEVGVNVPEATIMVIEHAERFGLSQLHQLRGRVGRGSDASTCLLLYSTPLSEHGKERLKIMRETEDGFLIAEKDLELRGAGEILGTRQSGLAHFKLADLNEHKDLLVMASQDARLFLEKDPQLKSRRGESLRSLLYLFEQDRSIQYLRSG